MKVASISRKILSGSLAFFLLSSNFSFLGVVLEPVINNTYASVYPAYDPNVVYASGGTFSYQSININVTGTGVGNTNSTYSPGCDTKDIAVWSGTSIQIWAACNAGANTSYSGSGQSVNFEAGGPTTGSGGQTSYMGYYYQWHRNEPITGVASTGVLANVSSGITAAGHSFFITGSTAYNYNWAAFTGTSSDPTWADSPCGSGYVIPFSSDWNKTVNILGTDLNFFETSLKLPRAGDRANDDQYIQGFGKYWAADPNGQEANGLWFDSNGSGSIDIKDVRKRSVGSSVRCMMNLSPGLTANGQCGRANNGTFPPANFTNLTALEKCTTGTYGSGTESTAGWGWSCMGAQAVSCSAKKQTTTNTFNITKNYQATGSGLLTLFFSEPIRLSGIDGSGGTSDDATGSISGSGSPGISINNSLSNSGQLVFTASGLITGQSYELTLSNIVSLNYGHNGNDRQLPMNFKYLFTWGTAGNNSTKLIDSNPQNRMSNVAIGMSDMSMYFSNELSGATVTSTGIQLYQDNVLFTGSISSSYTGVTLPSGTSGGKISTTIPPGSLLAGKNYKLVIPNTIRDIKGYFLDGTSGYGNNQEIFFSTISNVTTQTGANPATASSLYIRSTVPFPGAFGVPTNSKLQVEFSDPIDATGSNLEKVRVFAFSGANDMSGILVTSLSRSLDVSGKILTLSGGLLGADKKYELRATGDLRSVFGTYLGGGTGATIKVVYSSNFTTATGSDTTPVKIAWTYPGSGATNQSIDIRSIDIGFDKALDTSSVSTQTLQLSQNNTLESGVSVTYEVGTKTVHMSKVGGFQANTTYQVTVLGGANGVKTLAGNALQGGGNSTFSFTTGGSTNIDPFIISEAQVYPTKILVRFSRDVIATSSTSADYTSSVLNPENIYMMKYATGVTLGATSSPETIFGSASTVNLSGSTFSYDSSKRELTIMNFPTSFAISTSTTTQNLVGFIMTGVTDTKGNTLSSTNGGSKFYGPIMSENFLNTVGGTTTATTVYNIYDFTPVSLVPDINMAGKTTRYHLSFPTTQILGSGSIIELAFPTGFDVSNVSKDTISLYPNSNITGSGNFSFEVATGSSNKVILTLTNADSHLKTGQKTYINMDLVGVVNPTAAMQFGTDGYKVDVTTKTVGGSMILESLRSNAIFIQSAGAYTLSVQLQTSTGASLSVPNLLVRLNGSQLGMIEGLSDAGGLVTFSGLSSGEYYVGTDPMVLNNTHTQTAYLGNPVPTRVSLAGNQTMNMKLSDSTSDLTLKTLSLNISSLPANEKIVVWASSPSGYFEKKFSASSTGSIVDTWKLKADKWQVGVRPDFGSTAASSMMNYVQPTWQSPLSSEIDMRSTSGTYTKVINSANRILSVTLTDGTNPIPGASVWAYSPGGQIMGSNGMTDTNGQVQLKLMDGSYTIGARAEGLPPIPETSITMSSSTTLSLVVRKPSLQIGGKILSGDNGLQNAGVYAYQIRSSADPKPVGNSVNAMTDANGSYKFFVNENTTWKIGAFVPGIGGLDERIVSVGSSNVTENFLASAVVLYSVTGSVANLPSNTFANIWAESTDALDYYGNFTTTALDGSYSLQLKSGKVYKLHAFVPGHGEIGLISLAALNANLPGQNFNVGSTLNALTINIQSAGTNTVVDEFLIDYINTTTKVGGTKKILANSGVILDLAPASYEVRIAMPGSSRLPSQNINLGSGSGTLNFALANVPVTLSGTVRDQGGGIITEAVVEVFNTGGINLSTKTDNSGNYTLKVKGGTIYQIMTKKSGYIADSFTGVTVGSVSIGSLNLALRNTSTASDIITVAGSIYLGSGTSDNLAKQSAKVWAQGYNADGTKNEKWAGADTDENGGYILKLKTGLIWKISSRADGYEKIESISIGSGVVTNQSGKDIVLDLVSGYTIKSPVSTNMNPNNGGVLNDNKNKIKLVLPVGALDGSKESVTVITKETSNVVDNGNSKPIGGSAKDIQAMYTDGSAVTDFNSDVDIELSYSSGELLSALGSSGYTLENINNLLVSYFDNASSSWRTIATTVLLYNSGGTLLGNSDSISVLEHVTLRAKTNHLTLFTSLVSTIVTQSVAASSSSSSSSSTPSTGGSSGGSSGGSISSNSVSLTTGIVSTLNSVSKYLGDTTQSIVLKSGANINTVLSITRDGKTIALTDLLKTSASTLSNVSKNLVSFAVGDVVSTSKDGSLEIALDGYSKMQLNPGSSMKISEAGSGFLSYENIGGSVQYQFDKRDGGKFEYKVKGKTGYATIRGTTLDVSSDTTKDTYKLIEGKIDIYNAFLKKTVSLVSGDSYIAYANGTEDVSKIATVKTVVTTATPATSSSGVIMPTPQTTTVPSILTCGAFGDVLKTSEFCPYITKLNEKGIARTNTTFEPNRSISRAELLKMASLSKGGANSFDKQFTYADINSTDWWAPYVSTAKHLGYISAINNNFEPNRPITRAEAMKIIMNFSGIKISYDAKYTYSDIKSTDWSAPFISTAKKSGIISTTATNFRPNDPISRAEVSKILYNIFFQ